MSCWTTSHIYLSLSSPSKCQPATYFSWRSAKWRILKMYILETGKIYSYVASFCCDFQSKSISFSRKKNVAPMTELFLSPLYLGDLAICTMPLCLGSNCVMWVYDLYRRTTGQEEVGVGTSSDHYEHWTVLQVTLLRRQRRESVKPPTVLLKGKGRYILPHWQH
jgi:hypothetical protein